MAHTAPIARTAEPRVLAWVLPFGLFVGFLALQAWVPTPQWLGLALELALFLEISRAPLSVMPAPVVEYRAGRGGV